jgi:hypothetical protein
MNLRSLSDKILLSKTLLLAQKEREILSELLWHLKEIDARKLYSDLRCSSLFDYCVKILKYSEGQASRRVSATRLLKEIPQIVDNIKSGELNLTQINQANNFFHEMHVRNPKEKLEILEQIKGKTTRETDKILWELRGEEAPRKIHLILNEETVKQLKEVQKLKSHKYENMDSLIMGMCHEFQKLWDPTVLKRKSRGSQVNKRHISVSLKAEVWKKANGKCSLCSGTSRLEIDHIKPFALGGKTEQGNLRLLCRNCNQRAGMKIFGEKRKFQSRDYFL